jgi:hypothetical protein
LWSKDDLGKNVRPYPKTNQNRRSARGVAQVVEHLPSKHGALSSPPKKIHILYDSIDMKCIE